MHISGQFLFLELGSTCISNLHLITFPASSISEASGSEDWGREGGGSLWQVSKPSSLVEVKRRRRSHSRTLYSFAAAGPGPLVLETRKWTGRDARSCLMDSLSLLDLFLLNLVPCCWWSVCYLGGCFAFLLPALPQNLLREAAESPSGVFYRFVSKIQDCCRARASPLLCAPFGGARRTRKVISSPRLGTQMEKVLHLFFPFSLHQECWLLSQASCAQDALRRKWSCAPVRETSPVWTHACQDLLQQAASQDLAPCRHSELFVEWMHEGCFSTMCFTAGRCGSVAECQPMNQ